LTERPDQKHNHAAVRILSPVGLRLLAPVVSKRDSDNLLGVRGRILMRRVLVVLAVLAFCSATTWADGILDVNICGTFTATTTQATETIALSFLFDPASITPYPYGNGSIDASTVVMSSAGFLGSFSPDLSANGTLIVGWNESYVPFKNGNGDEIDIATGIGPNFFPVGTNTIGLDIYTCASDCVSAYGSQHPGYILPTSETSTVTPVAVPDETSFLSLGLTSVGAVGLVWHWRRRDSQRA